MDVGVAWRAGAVQAIAVGVLFAALVAAPLPEDFFEDWGALTGPAAWIACVLVTAALLGLPLRAVAIAAAAGGAAGAAAGLGIHHTLGLLAAVLVFGAVTGRLARRAAPR